MSSNSKIRTRFAPSPTGFLHVGGLRTALYNYLLTRQQDGDFVLRIEDTDQTRKVEGAIENLIKTLEQVGLDYNEGPMIEKDRIVEQGEFGPYIQSQRLDIYQQYVNELIKKDKAYYCFCTAEHLKTMRQEQEKKKQAPMYDERCRNLSQQEVEEKLKNKIPYVVRLKLPTQGKVEFKDTIRGQVEFNYSNLDDQVLLKSDGYPTYHLANVIDDHLMHINHVIRGEEWLPSTPKHIFLYQSFDWPVPQFSHLPLILNPDKTKLSKRQGDVAVEDYLNKGYLTEALINFIAFLGWNPGDDREIFSLQELIKEFDLSKVGKSGAVFNLDKLNWLNGHYIRQMDIKDLTHKCLPFLIKAKLVKSVQSADLDYIQQVIQLEQERLKRLDEIADLTHFFFKDKLNYEAELLIWKKSDEKHALSNLSTVKQTLEKINAIDFNKENIEKNLMPIAQDRGVGDVLWPMRAALTGEKNSPGPFEVAHVLGKERVLDRLEKAIRLLEK